MSFGGCGGRKGGGGEFAAKTGDPFEPHVERACWAMPVTSVYIDVSQCARCAHAVHPSEEARGGLFGCEAYQRILRLEANGNILLSFDSGK